MAILRGMDGKFYDVPDDQAAGFEVPRDKVKELLETSGAPSPKGGPGPSARGQRGAPPGGPIVIQIYPGGAGPSGAPSGGQPAEGGEVDPYWYYWPNWGNYWPNWGNY